MRSDAGPHTKGLGGTPPDAAVRASGNSRAHAGGGGAAEAHIAVRRAVLPSEGDAASSYYFRRLYAPYSAGQRLLRVVGSRCPRVASALLGDPAPAAWERRIDAVRRVLQSGLLASVGLPDARSWILLGGDVGRVPDARHEGVVALLFSGDGPAPMAVLKVRSRSADASGLEREASALRWLDGRAGIPGRRPLLLARTAVAGLDALLLSVVRGRSQYVRLRTGSLGSSPRRHLARAGAWLAAFHRRTRHPERLVGLPDALSEPGRVGEPPWWGELRARLARERLPSSASHGDFWPGNVLTDADGLGVIDWEHFRPQAPPFEDLFHYPLTLGLLWHPRGAGPVEPMRGFRRAFLDPGPLAEAVRGYALDYCRATGLDPGLLDPLFRAYLLTRSGDAATPAGGRGFAGTRNPDFWRRCYETLARTSRSVFSG